MYIFNNLFREQSLLMPGGGPDVTWGATKNVLTTWGWGGVGGGIKNIKER